MEPVCKINSMNDEIHSCKNGSFQSRKQHFVLPSGESQEMRRVQRQAYERAQVIAAPLCDTDLNISRVAKRSLQFNFIVRVLDFVCLRMRMLVVKTF